MRKILVLLLCCLLLAGCGNAEKKDNTNGEEETNQAIEQSGEDEIENNYSSTETVGAETDNKEVVKDKKYDISNDDFVDFTVYDDGSLECLININDTEKMSLAFAYFYSGFSELDGYSTSICGKCENGIILWVKTESGESTASVDNEGNSTNDFPDWAYDTLENPSMSQEEQGEFVEILKGFSEDFIN